MNEISTQSLPTAVKLKQKAIDLNLDGLSVFYFYTNEEMERVYNGIGPDRFPSWLRDMISECNHVLLPAVLIHDLDYDHGGTLDDFFKANSRLCKNMSKCAKEKYGKHSLKTIYYTIKAKFFKMLCDQFGEEGWNLHV